jgi:hypothetical protein
MVDLALLQSVSYIAGALGVCVAAFYYVVNLRETTKNRKIAFTTNFMQNFYSKENSRRFIDLLGMRWNNIDEYMSKYDSRVNPENFADRWSFLGMLDVLGYQYKTGLVDIDTIYDLNWSPVLQLWIKFRPIINEYKKSDYGVDTYANFELLARKLWELKGERDPRWKEHKGGGVGNTPEDYEKAFAK